MSVNITDEKILNFRTRKDILELTIWKKVFHLPAEPVWYYTIIALNYITVIGYLTTAVNGECMSQTFQNLHISAIFNIMDGIYLVDIILVILSMYIPKLHLPDINISARPLYLICIELLSALPLQLMMPWFKKKPVLYCVLNLNSVLRIVRIIYFHNKRNTLITTKMYMKVIQLFSYVIFVVMIVYVAYCNLFCAYHNCNVKSCDRNSIKFIVSKVIGAGHICFPKDLSWKVVATLGQLIIFYSISTVAMAHVTIGLITVNRNQIRYLDRSNILVTRLKKLELPRRITNNLKEYYDIIWKKTRGYSTNNSYWRFLHPSMITELMIDVFWPALKHSSLFRSIDLNYLRYLASYIQLEYMLPGQYLYSKDEWKDKMVYVASGTIQLISNEDLESPLISFSAGTCIGESCLVIDYKSLHHVVCKTFCEFHVLYKKDFIRSYFRHPKEYKMAKALIFERYRNTRILNDISTIAKSKLVHHRNIDIYTLLWVKNTLHKLMAVDEESTYRHEIQNIYFISEINEKDFNQLSFTAKYLDMLVVGERIEVDTDTVFVQIKFPCILQPKSIIGIMWETLIIFLTLILSFTIPYMSFIETNRSPWYYPLVCFVTHIYWLDIYVQLSTSVRSKHGILTRIRDIATRKMQTFGLWVDIISCFPFEMFTSIIAKKNTPQIQATMHINRLLKLWRVERLFRVWESKFNANLVAIRYVKFSWINLYTTFLFYCLLYYFKKSSTIYMLFASVQIVCTTSIVDRAYTSPDTLESLGNISSKFITLIMYASIMSAYILLYLKKFEVQHMCVEMLNIIKKRNLGQRFKERIMNVIYTEWDDNECALLKRPRGIVFDIPTYINEEVMCYLAEEAVRSQKILATFSDIAIYDICAKTKVIVWPQDEPITYSGHIETKIYFVIQGTYDVLTDNSRILATISDEGCLNLLEILFDTPSMYTVIARSNCRCLLLKYKDLRKIFQRHYYESKALFDTVKGSADIKEIISNNIRYSKSDIASFGILKKPNFFRFKLKMRRSSYSEYDYHIPFDRLYPFAFVRYFLMRTTINCEGRFIFCWEISRCFFAFTVGLLNFILPIFESSYWPILYFLDIIGLIDIYVRLHVCYYDSHGLIITHPLKTATHYLRTAFITDLIAVLPLGFLFKQYSAKNSISYFLSNLNKLLPMYRYVQFFNFIQGHILTPSHKSVGLTFIPIVLLLGNFFGSFLMSTECSFSANNTVTTKNGSEEFLNMNCTSDSIMALSPFKKPMGPWRAHLYAWYIGVSMLTTSGMQGFVASSDDARIIMMIMSLLGFYLTVVFAGKYITLYFFYHRLLLKYQEGMRFLNEFLNWTRVNPQLKKTIVNSYELKWRLHKGRNLHQIFQPLCLQTQYDLLYEIYGKKLYHTSIFTTKTKRFYRNLMPKMKHDVIFKGGYLVTINDICANTFILYKGVIEVLAPDGTLTEVLSTGSMFGNLEKQKWCRQRVSVVANCHVEVLAVPTIEFHRLLEYEPPMKEEYRNLKLKYINYIPGQVQQQRKSIGGEVEKPKTIWTHVFNPKTRGMKIWRTLNLCFPCYFGIHLDLYQLAACEYSFYMIILQYCNDALYAAQYFLKLRTAFEDETGMLVTDLRRIAKKHCEKKVHLAIGIISLMPLDLMALTMTNIEYSRRMIAYGLLRTNRLLRLFYIFRFFTSCIERLNVNIYLIRFGFVLLWSALALSAITAALTMISCPFEVNIEPAVPSCRAIVNMPSYEKFKIFVSHAYLAADFLNFASQNRYYPNGAIHIFFFIIMMVISQNLFYICISQIYSVMSECSQRRISYVNNMERLKTFMSNEDVSISLVDRVINYVQLLWVRQRGDIYPSLLLEAPQYLQDAILNDAFRFLFVDHPIFARCHSDCLRQIIQKCTARTFFRGDYVQFKGVIDNTMYIIFSGEIAVLDDEAVFDDVLSVMKSGNSFGVRQGLNLKKPHRYTYKALVHSVLVMLNYELWEHLLPFFPASKEEIFSALKKYVGIRGIVENVHENVP